MPQPIQDAVQNAVQNAVLATTPSASGPMAGLDETVALVGGTVEMTTAAGEVILRRVGMMVTGTMSAPEAVGMVAEKLAAVMLASQGAAFAALSGNPIAVGRAMLAPYHAKTSENVARLRQESVAA